MKQTAILFYRLHIQKEEGGFAGMAQRLFSAVRRESKEAKKQHLSSPLTSRIGRPYTNIL